MKNQTLELANQVLQQENREKEAIALLLDKYLGRGDRLLVQKTQMGNSTAFIGSVTLEWLDNRVRFASQLPLFQQKLDPQTKNMMRDAETIEEIQQRPLDWSRQASLTQYLITRKSHKFPAVLVVISPSWVDQPKAPQWDKKGVALTSAADFSALDKSETVGLLDVGKEVSIFALDGQHRLMGVQGLMSLLKTGKLLRYNKQKKPLENQINLNELITQYQLELPDLQNLAQEQIGIEFIPAVEKGETREEARLRIRSIFVHVNMMAVKLSHGQLALLNEDDGFSIVARKIASSHPLLKDKARRNPRVNWDSATIASKSTVLTTLQALKDMSERYLYHKFPHWKATDKGLIPMRPTVEELEKGIKEFKQLFDYLAMLPSYEKIESDTETASLRRFSFEKPGGEANVLFRPVGQVAIAQALGVLIFQKRFDIKDIFERLIKYDIDNGFTGMEFPESLWYGVLYDPNKKRVSVSGKDLAAKLIIYILGGIQDTTERAELRFALAQARAVGDNQAMSFNGKFVELKKVGLPPILV